MGELVTAVCAAVLTTAALQCAPAGIKGRKAVVQQGAKGNIYQIRSRDCRTPPTPVCPVSRGPVFVRPGLAAGSHHAQWALPYPMPLGPGLELRPEEAGSPAHTAAVQVPPSVPEHPKPWPSWLPLRPACSNLSTSLLTLGQTRQVAFLRVCKSVRDWCSGTHSVCSSLLSTSRL